MPMRSASSSLARVKLICRWASAPWAPISAAAPACGSTAAPSTAAAMQQRRGGYGHLLLRREGAQQVLLAHMRDFVRHHRGQLRFGFGGHNQPGVDADVAGWAGKGIDARVIDDEKVVAAGLVAAGRDERLPRVWT
jgi:hypothetical protein